MNPEYQDCIEACEQCADACDHCAAACLAEADVNAMVACIRLDMDCAQICRLAAAAMARGSAFSHEICRLCADICDTCAEECDQHEYDHCRECAQACTECADACRRMLPLAPDSGAEQHAPM